MITLRAAASTDSQVAPTCAALNAAVCAAFSRFHTSICRADGLPNTVVRVMSDWYPSMLHPPSTSTTSPCCSRCGVMLPCGNAVYLPNCAPAPPPGAPSASNAARMWLPNSNCVMPSASVANAALYASMVMSLARCISAISAGDLIIRQPAVTGVARPNSSCGAAARRPSGMKKRTRSSTPTLPVATPRSFRMPATIAPQSSSSCQTRMSLVNFVISRARASSNPGATYASSPFAGITSRNGRSLVPQRTFTK